MPKKIRRDFGTKKEKKGHLYGSSFRETAIVKKNVFHIKQLLAHAKAVGDLSLQLSVVKDINKMLDYNWDDHVRGKYDYQFNFWNGETMCADSISQGNNHNLQTSAGLELENMTKAGIGGRLLDWVGIGVGFDEPTRGSIALTNEKTRIPVNPDGWLTPSSDLLFTGVIAGTNTIGGDYREAGGWTGNTADDVLGWICVLPESEKIRHEAGVTMMIWSHVEEVISLY